MLHSSVCSSHLHAEPVLTEHLHEACILCSHRHELDCLARTSRKLLASIASSMPTMAGRSS